MSNGLEKHLGAFRDPAQNQAWKDLMRSIDVIIVKTGIGPIQIIDPSAKNPSSSLRVSTPVVPPAAYFVAVGIDGKFIVTIENPENILPLSPTILRAQARVNINAQARIIYHNLQSATDVNFINSSNLKDYGVSPQLMWTDQDPNVTRFFRLRSSYDRRNWNQWQIFSSTVTCGPAGVASGFLRSTAAAPNMALNSHNNATVDSIDAGSDATIRVYGPGGPGNSFVRYDGQTGQTTIPAGTLLHQPYATQLWVIYSTANGYQAFTSAQYQSAIIDGALFAGLVTTVASGGGGGVSGGGSTGGGKGRLQ